MTSSEAWLLECGNSLNIAIGDHEMAEFVQQGNQFKVPGAPEYCQSVIVWQGNIVPVMDLAILHDPANPIIEDDFYLSVLNYQTAPNMPIQHLAIRVTGSPRKILVDDAQACQIPQYLNASVLGQISLACFERDELQVMIPDIARLCSAEFRELANAA